ncbi:MAG TPA: flagellar basal-body rod protein FlgG [Pirellulales bacterium]|jgi:flagellar basal-body rod protein FlgG|nr:flagellar basal-body rod protein FlgG [Pirellulales bacterium]
MSVQTLYTAATGMEALQQKLDVIANNLANVNTTGFKRDRANFEDLFYRTETVPGIQDAAGNYTPVGIQTGLGSKVQSTQADQTQGAFQQTNQPLDVAIQGNGYLQVTDPTGQILYSRAGNLSLNANGQLVVGDATVGYLLSPAISIPQTATSITIGADGKVSVQEAGSTTMQQVGQIQLARFINPQGLMSLGGNLLSQSDASGPPTQGVPGTNGIGTIQQGSLEASNVEPVNELIDLITTQRSFELNSQAIQAGDQIMQDITNLRRG